MVYNNKFNNILRNSKNIFYRFFMDNNKNLLLQEYNTGGLVTSFIFKENVIDYSVDIDKNDNANILCLCSNGNLIYSMYPKTHEDKILTQFQLNGNRIVFLFLKLLSSDVHIFYMVGNISNPYKWSIYHNIWHNSQWVSQKISDITSIKYAYPYFIESDSKNNLYLFFCKDGTNNYAIKKYSTEFNLWLDFEENLVLPGVNNVSFFVTNNNVEIICYNQCINRVIQTFVKHRDLTKLNSTWSNPILVSNTNSLHPCVFSKDNLIYIIWEEGNYIMYKTCNNALENWNEKKLLTIKNDYTFNAVYKSNYLKDSTLKVSYVYATFDKCQAPIINTEPVPNNLNKLSYQIPTKITHPLFRGTDNIPDKTTNEILEKLVNEISQIKEHTDIIEKSNEKLTEKLSVLEETKKSKWKRIFDIFK